MLEVVVRYLVQKVLKLSGRVYILKKGGVGQARQISIAYIDYLIGARYVLKHVVRECFL